jgi:hypothetical protein
MDNIVFFTEEAWSYLHGYIEIQNNSIWSAENPHALYEKLLNLSKIGVWSVVSRKRTVDHCSLNKKKNYGKLSRYFDSLQRFSERQKTGLLAGFRKMGRPPILRKQQQLSCRIS